MPRTYQLPPPDRHLLARAAEMLALPQRVCRIRACRRQGRCAWFFHGTQEPCCLANLDAAQRRLFDDVAAIARDVRDLGNSWGKLSFASPWRETRALQDAAVEVARPLLRGAALTEFRAFAAARAKKPPVRYEGDEPPLTV
ncbi:hypothetical protein WMC41_10710 [Shinella yambaruensis]|uniref:hypothetical protein n=1 Tax=Shinella yambaruensis TaxID=415996 RepID=UPI003D7B1227